MPFSAISHLLRVERARQRINRSVTAAGFATPAMGEIQLDEGTEPLLATNMRGMFLVTRRGLGDVARYGFSPCEVDEEHVLLTELARVLWELPTTHAWAGPRAGWSLRCTSVSEAVGQFRSNGLEPRTLIVSVDLAREVLGPDRQLPEEGLVGNVDQMQVLITNLPRDTALVALAPLRAGVCVRVGDNIGMLVRPEAFKVVHT